MIKLARCDRVVWRNFMKKIVFCIICSICFFCTPFFVRYVAASDWVEKGVALVLEGKYNEAIINFNKAIELDPKDAVAYNNRGVAYGELGNYEQEITDCSKAIEINPKLAVAYYHRGIAYQKLGNRKQAAKDKNKAYALNPRRTWGKVEIVSSEATAPSSNEKKIKVIGNRDSKRYHLPGMKYYNKVQAYHRVTFNSEEEAIKAGYHKASQ
jgi:tetratricopeptide (TPR) repeat protein